MADNVQVTPGSGATIAADDVGGALHQRVKMEWGADGTVNEIDAASGKGLPVQGEAPENAAATGNPVQIGGRYDETPRTLGDGDVGGLAVDAAGRAIIRSSYDEDAAHSSGDGGFPALAVRRDAKAVGSGTDGDYSTLNVNAGGDLRVDGGQTYVIRTTPTVTAGAYTAGDIIGGEQTLANAARISGGGGILTGVTFIAEDDDADGWAAEDIEILIFESDPGGTYTDNNALDGSALTDADAALVLGTVLLDTKVDLGNVSMLKSTNVNLAYLCSGGTSLYAVAVNRGGKTPEATDAINIVYHFIRD